MTIGGYFLFITLGLVVLTIGIGIAYGVESYGKHFSVIAIVVSVLLVVALFFGMRWYFNSTASGQRALLDQKSDFSNGVERVINVYTANGDKIATYKGKIDLDVNDGGYVKFDFNGKRYIYYNCFVETIADIS